jgi:hypothetical protein
MDQKINHITFLNQIIDNIKIRTDHLQSNQRKHNWHVLLTLCSHSQQEWLESNHIVADSVLMFGNDLYRAMAIDETLDLQNDFSFCMVNISPMDGHALNLRKRRTGFTVIGAKDYFELLVGQNT